MTLLGVLAFIVALLVSVMLHEGGHFVLAKRFGMKITEFFVGFGPRIYSRVRGETEYGIKVIPAGGYVRIVGMSPSEPIAAEDGPRAFYRASTGRKVAVLSAGSITHIVVGFLLIFLLLVGVGVTSQTTTIASVPACLTTSASGACTASDLPSPALKAGLHAGDRILAINGVAIRSWDEVVKIIRRAANQQLQIKVARADQEITVNVMPTLISGHGVLGVVSKLSSNRVNPFTSVRMAGSTTWSMAKQSITSLIGLPAKIPQVWQQTFGGRPRDASGLVGVVGVARVSGEAIAANDLSWAERIGAFVSIIAGLNIFIGIFNMLPLPPLDGGHIAVALVDRWRSVWARRRGRSVPAAVDVTSLTPITLIVLGVLLSLSLLLLAADIVNPVRLNL